MMEGDFNNRSGPYAGPQPVTRVGATTHFGSGDTRMTMKSTPSFTAVIQCAARKRPNAGHLTTEDGKRILFVADPASAPRKPDIVYRHPDDVARSGLSWRDELANYNEAHGSTQANPLGLLPAWRLYQEPTYEYLVDRLGAGNVFILSAGWGLVSAAFLTPNYDITFTKKVENYKRRRSRDRYADFSMLPTDTSTPILFLGGKDYVPLFCKLTEGTMAERRVYHFGKPPYAPNCRVVRFETKRRTNWHYECARSLC